MSDKKIFWLGNGTLGDIKNGEEIPKGFLDVARLRKFEKEGLVGEKLVANIDTDDEKTSQIKDLTAANAEFVASLKASEKEISDLKKQVAKLESESEESLKIEIAELKKENKKFKKAK